MGFECKICKKKFDSKESLIQHNQAKHSGFGEEKKDKKNIKKYALLAVFLVAIIIFSYTLYFRSSGPGRYDELAKCLGEKAVIYGNDFCQYTNKQLNMFGNSKKLLNYVKCIDNKELCDSKNVKITPAWEIKGVMYEGVQNFEKLSSLSGCKT